MEGMESLEDQMRKDSWEARKKGILNGSDPEQMHLDPEKSDNDARIDPTLH